MMAFFHFQHLFFFIIILAVCIAILLAWKYFAKRLLIYKLRRIERYLRNSEEVFYISTRGPVTVLSLRVTMQKWQKDFDRINNFIINSVKQITDNGSEENLVFFKTMQESLCDCRLQLEKLIKESQHEQAVSDDYFSGLRRSFFRFSSDFNVFTESSSGYISSK